jgi:hypothetical protein
MIKKCNKCGIEKDTTEFYKDKIRSLGVRDYCKVCIRLYRANHHGNNPVPVMLRAAKHRAKRDNVPFTLTQSDITVPTHCPILGIELAVSHSKGGTDNSPSLDKINPELGYVPGNVQVISQLANVMKNSATLEQIISLGTWAARQYIDTLLK